MLSEAELRELRGIAFDRLLLQLWPKFNMKAAPKHCRSCGRTEPYKNGRVVSCRGLCNRCYKKWKYHHRDEPQDTWPTLRSGYKEYDDLLMAKRIGVNLATMSGWRAGKQIPRLSTLRSAAPNLEVEFGVPAALWIEAAAISNHARGWILAKGGQDFTYRRRHIPQSHDDPVGRQYGYWLILAVTRICPGPRRRDTYVKVKCLLCASVQEKLIRLIRHSQSRQCRACARRLTIRRGASGFKGVQWLKHRQSWRALEGVSGRPGKTFKDPAAAARCYDAYMYECYGHTLFLNFPDEYDQSNDPVFVPAGKAAA